MHIDFFGWIVSNAILCLKVYYLPSIFLIVHVLVSTVVACYLLAVCSYPLSAACCLNRKCTSQKKKWNIRWKKILGPSILSLWWYCSVLIANNVYCIHFVEDFGDHAGSLFTWMLSSAYDPFTEVIFGEISMLFAYNNHFWTRCMISTTFAAKILQCCLLSHFTKWLFFLSRCRSMSLISQNMTGVSKTEMLAEPLSGIRIDISCHNFTAPGFHAWAHGEHCH
jgi:hypothetical protein